MSIPEIIVLHQNLFLGEPISNNETDSEGHHRLIQSVSNFAGPTLKPKLRLAAEEKFNVVVIKQNWCSRYPLRRDSSFVQETADELELPAVKFSSVPSGISDYMRDACYLVGTFIEIFVVKNNIVKETVLVFKNNLLYSTTNKKDTPLNILSALKNGLTVLTKICSGHVVLRNFLVESCSYMINILEHVSNYEQKLSSDSRRNLLKALENALARDFLSTLSTDSWSRLLPNLLASSLETGNCHKLNPELLAVLNNDIFDMVMIASVHEISSQLKEKYKPYVEIKDPLVHELKKHLLLIKDVQTKSELTLEVAEQLPAQDVFDLLTMCLESKELMSEDLQTRAKKRLRETKWCNQVTLHERIFYLRVHLRIRVYIKLQLYNL